MDVSKYVDISIKNVLKEGLTDIFDRPFEIDMLNNKIFREKVKKHIIKTFKANNLESLGINEIEYVLLPKNSPFNFRKCALIQPMDTLIYTNLVLSIASNIEKARIPISKKKVYSYRYYPNKGFLFNRNYSITSFRKRAFERSKLKKTKFVVHCDIANYYDRLNLHRLENILYSIGCPKDNVRLIDKMLKFWSGNNSYGLPVGSNASRILAEANLIGVDNFLYSNNVDFIRFVDDYRIFAPDSNTAHYWLTMLIERLWQEGLTINTSKTKILSKEEYKKNIHSFDKINKNKKVGNPFIIQAGYAGTVPTRYRQMSAKEQDKLKQLNYVSHFNSIKDRNYFESEEIINLVKIIISQELFDNLYRVVLLLENYLQLTPYVIDAIIKHSMYISTSTKNKIKDYFISCIINRKQYIPDYLLISYIKILGAKGFESKDVLVNIFRNLKRNSSVYIGRCLLEALSKDANREDVLEIRKTFKRADLWEKRQIIKMVKDRLAKEEREAWLRNIKYIERNELFLQEIPKL